MKGTPLHSVNDEIAEFTHSLNNIYKLLQNLRHKMTNNVYM